MAQIRKIYVPRNLTLPEIEKAFLSINRAIILNSYQDRLNVVETTTDLTLDETHDVVIGKTNAVTITLPPAATYYSSVNAEGKAYYLGNDPTNVNDVTIQADGSELIGTANTLTVPPGAFPNVVTNGTKWFIF